ncbi:hypothetical protein Poly51_21330 [Rubripirellula tenax]|uniref:IncA protein n=1 Tax=Rubripirellula tenax TaxID=2528015 RepID=A0A5C6FD40_9BACT|nr:hypothetical protein [Rubripirellula tenax]TWU59345.1 hypothetical protein Poly51_21330 [Rubripirellula tenax]
MSRRKRGGMSPSLFPFLAVLVCTLGTLILLLALVSQDATDNAKKQADAARAKAQRENDALLAAKTVEPAADLAPRKPQIAAEAATKMIAEEDFRVTQLVAFRDKQTADLEDRRDKLAHVENHIGRLRTELKQLSGEVDRAVGGDESPAVDDATLASYRQKIEEVKETIETLRVDSGKRTPRVVIVPHKGPNGTDRRPIYLECVAEGLTIWPEGNRITRQQLENAESGANPLDAALRAVRHHAMQTYGDTTPPYPLLVVRPDGIDTYGMARGAMENWDDQFGYELVPAEVKLAYAQPDSNLKRELDAVIARETRNQSARSIASGFGYGGGGIGTGLGGSGMGGVNRSGSGGLGASGATASGSGTGGAGPRSRPRVLSAASLDRDGRSRGYHGDQDFSDFGSSSSSKRSPYVSGSGQAGESSVSGAATNGYTGTGAYTQNNPSEIDPAMQSKWADDMKAAAQEMKSGDFPNGSTGGGRQFAGTAGVTDANGEDFDGMTLGGPTQSDNASSENSTQNGTGSDGTEPGGAGDSATGAPAMQGFANQGTSSSASKATSKMSAGTTGTGGTQSAGSPSTAAQQGQSSASDDDSQSQSGAPQMQMDLSPPPRELVRRQGRDWALPPEVAGMKGNSVVRTIRVLCYEDRFVLLPPASGGATEMFGIDGNRIGRDAERATLELATSVRDRVQRWGVALPGGRWQPRLDVEVMPGGEQRFHQLRSLMDGSGVQVSGRGSQ